MSKQFWTALSVIPTITTFYCIDQYLLSIRNSEGSSMCPTIRPGDIIFVDRLFYRFNKLKKGDIVIAYQPISPETYICKRIIAEPGEPMPYGVPNDVPADCYWLQGDNKDSSFDSRHHGVVTKNLILGKVFYHLSL